MWRLVWMIPTWILHTAIWLPLCLLGHIAIPLALVFRAFELRDSQYYPKKVWAWKWRWMWLWGNEEDGIIAGRQYKNFKSDSIQAYYWSAIRNPVNNLRFAPILSCKIRPEKVQFVGSFSRKYVLEYDTKFPQWFLAWDGPYSNFYWQFYIGRKLYRFWIGWKIYPTDIYGVTEYRKHGAGFAYQFKKV